MVAWVPIYVAPEAPRLQIVHEINQNEKPICVENTKRQQQLPQREIKLAKGFKFSHRNPRLSLVSKSPRIWEVKSVENIAERKLFISPYKVDGNKFHW